MNKFNILQFEKDRIKEALFNLIKDIYVPNKVAEKTYYIVRTDVMPLPPVSPIHIVLLTMLQTSVSLGYTHIMILE